MVLMRVFELAGRSGVAATALRCHEERGLLSAQRSPAGHRLYDGRALDRPSSTTVKHPDLEEIGELGALEPVAAEQWCRALVDLRVGFTPNGCTRA